MKIVEPYNTLYFYNEKVYFKNIKNERCQDFSHKIVFMAHPYSLILLFYYYYINHLLTYNFRITIQFHMNAL